MKKEKTVKTMESIIGKTTEDRPRMVAPTKGVPEYEFYNMSLRMFRETADKLADAAKQRHISLQGIVSEAVDRYMREEGIGTFLPEGKEWPTKKTGRKGQY
jgi:hypothetical protein